MNVRTPHPTHLFLTVSTLALAATLLTPHLLAQSSYAQPQYPQTQDSQQDPPSRVARISLTQGNVSLEPAGVDTFSEAELNFPLTAGDRIYADNASMAELQTAGLALRLGNGADVTLSSLTDFAAQFGLAQGSVRLRTRDLTTPDGQPGLVEIDTPNGTITIQSAGDIRVDSYPQDDSTVITVSSGQVAVTAPNINQLVGPNQSLRLSGSNPVYAEPVRVLPPDAIDQFDAQRERLWQSSAAVRLGYVDPEMIGAADLDPYGDWNPTPDYGQVWFPRAVPADWTPYSNGHWAWVAPWGWTWIEAEPWGFAPFHYGRWASFNGRWGWVPGAGAPGGRRVRPVYSPALVAFVGGPNFSVSVGFRRDSGGGVTGWFPLGPREAYTPWYHASPRYLTRINRDDDRRDDDRRGNGRRDDNRNADPNRPGQYGDRQNAAPNYVNRPLATVAVAQRDFASGRRVAESQHIRMDANTQRQLQQAPILPHPLVTPATTAAAPQRPARVMPPNEARPDVQNRNGYNRGNTPADTEVFSGRNPNPVANPNRPQRPTQYPAQITPPAPAQAPIPVHAGAPAHVADGPQPAPATQNDNSNGYNRGRFPQQRDHTPIPAAQAPAQPAQNPNPGRPIAIQPTPAQPAPNQPTQQMQQQRPPRQMPAQVPAPTAVQNPPQRPDPRPVDQPRPLINRVTPQPAQPPFVRQQRAIERTDPGRPLGPAQVDNIRNGRPAGPPTQPEPVPHPANAAPARPEPADNNQQHNHGRPDQRPPQ